MFKKAASLFLFLFMNSLKLGRASLELKWICSFVFWGESLLRFNKYIPQSFSSFILPAGAIISPPFFLERSFHGQQAFRGV